MGVSTTDADQVDLGWLTKDLNDAQARAVLHDATPLVVLAGAGSGKTRVLTRRIARLIASGVSPSQILAITFTNKSADEMRRRVVELVGDDAKVMWISTFHSALWCAYCGAKRASRDIDPGFRSTTTTTVVDSLTTFSTIS